MGVGSNRPHVISSNEKGASDGLGRQGEEQEGRGCGRAKEHIGKATHDEQMEDEGKTDQSVSNLKQAGEKVKDAFKKD